MRVSGLLVILFIAAASAKIRQKRFLFGSLFGGMGQAPSTQQSYQQKCWQCGQYYGSNYGGNYGGNQGGGWSQPGGGWAQSGAGAAAPGFSVSPQQAIAAFGATATLVGAANQFANNQNHHRAPVVLHHINRTPVTSVYSQRETAQRPNISPALRAAAASAVNAAFAAAVTKAGGKNDDRSLPEWLRNELIYQTIRNAVGNPLTSFSGFNSASGKGMISHTGSSNGASEVLIDGSLGKALESHPSHTPAYAPGTSNPLPLPGPPGINGGVPPVDSTNVYVTPPPPPPPLPPAYPQSPHLPEYPPSAALPPPSSALYLTPPPKNPSYISPISPPSPPPTVSTLPSLPSSSYGRTSYRAESKESFSPRSPVSFARSHRTSDMVTPGGSAFKPYNRPAPGAMENELSPTYEIAPLSILTDLIASGMSVPIQLQAALAASSLQQIPMADAAEPKTIVDHLSSGSNADVSNAGGKTKRKRTTFTASQAAYLEKEYDSDQYMPRSRRIAVAESLQLSENQIKTWFQNRRAKDKKIRSMTTVSSASATMLPSSSPMLSPAPSAASSSSSSPSIAMTTQSHEDHIPSLIELLALGKTDLIPLSQLMRAFNPADASISPKI